MIEADDTQDGEILPPEGQQEGTLMQRIDSLADFLCTFAKREDATPAIRVKIFNELVSWAKVKRVIDPKGLEGSRLKEFHNELKGGQGNRSPRRFPGAAKIARDRETRNAVGADIRNLIRSLPSVRNAGGDQVGAERPSVGDPGADLGGGADVSRDGQGDGNGPGDRSVV